MENNMNSIYNKSVPANWRKLGEVYGNVNGQSAFVCFICLERNISIETTYNTSDASAFWWHIKQQHMTECSDVKEVSAITKSSQNTVESDRVYEVAEPTDLKRLINEVNATKSLELFHQNLVENLINSEAKEMYERDIENEFKENARETHRTTPNEIARDIKFDRISTCNYYYDNQSYTISDNDDDGYSAEGENVENHMVEHNSIDYLKHNDLIELSDDEDNDDIINIPTNLQLLPSGLEVENHTNSLNHRQANVIQANIFGTHLNSLPMHSVDCILTAQVSSNDLQKHLNTNSNINGAQFNYFPQVYNENSNQEQISCKQKFKKNAHRPFKCRICGKRTGNEIAMQIHQKRFHSLESDFETTLCEICQKRIYVPNLQLHMQVHNKAAFKCNYCGLRYKHKQTLKNHIKKLHSF